MKTKFLEMIVVHHGCWQGFIVVVHLLSSIQMQPDNYFRDRNFCSVYF